MVWMYGRSRYIGTRRDVAVRSAKTIESDGEGVGRINVRAQDFASFQSLAELRVRTWWLQHQNSTVRNDVDELVKFNCIMARIRSILSRMRGRRIKYSL